MEPTTTPPPISANQPTTLRPTPPTPPPRIRSRKSFYVGGGVVIFLIALGLGAYALFRPKTTPPPPTKKIYTIYASAQLDYEDGRNPINGARLAYEEAARQERDYALKFIVLNDSDAYGGWDDARLRQNIKTAVNDPTTLAFFGTINSTAAKIAIPILNNAGIAMFSPTNSWPGLTKFGFSVDEPGRYYPTQTRNYARLASTDELELVNSANWMKQLGVKTMTIATDDSLDPATALILSKRTDELGMVAKSRISLSGKDILESARAAIAARADIIYYLGANGVTFIDFANQLYKMGYKGKLMASDSVLTSQTYDIAKELEGYYFTSVNTPLALLKNPSSTRFIDAYTARFMVTPDVYAGMGYESMRLLIDAIDRSDKTRPGVIRMMLNTQNFPTMFGDITIDGNGDNSNGATGVSLMKHGKLQYIGIIGRTATLP